METSFYNNKERNYCSCKPYMRNYFKYNTRNTVTDSFIQVKCLCSLHAQLSLESQLLEGEGEIKFSRINEENGCEKD